MIAHVGQGVLAQCIWELNEGALIRAVFYRCMVAARVVSVLSPAERLVAQEQRESAVCSESYGGSPAKPYASFLEFGGVADRPSGDRQTVRAN
jgi:hypothetical protein